MHTENPSLDAEVQLTEDQMIYRTVGHPLDRRVDTEHVSEDVGDRRQRDPNVWRE